MARFYPVHYCLSNESDFEDYHPLFDKSANELLLALEDINLLLDKCMDDSDNVGISYGGEETGKWDVLDIHGIDGRLYTLEYLVGFAGGSYFKRNVSRSDVIEAIGALPGHENFIEPDFEFIHW
jgi:hypothetical protein